MTEKEEYRDTYNGAYRTWYHRDGGAIVPSFAGAGNFENEEWFSKPMSGSIETITEPYPWEVDGKNSGLLPQGIQSKRTVRISVLSVLTSTSMTYKKSLKKLNLSILATHSS